MTWNRTLWLLVPILILWLAGARLQSAALLQAMAVLVGLSLALILLRALMELMQGLVYIWRLYRSEPGSKAEFDLIESRFTQTHPTS